MTDQEKNIAEWSDKILQFLLDKRKENPDLKFWVRHRNTNNRIDKGLWFQGTGNYIFVGFFNRSGGSNITRSIGFVVGFDKDSAPISWIEIAFNEENDSEVLEVYKNVIDRIGGFDKKRETNYQRTYQTQDVFENLEIFLNTHLPIMEKIIKEKDVENKFIQTDEDFNSSLQKILEKRVQLKNQPSIYMLKPLIDAFEKWYVNDAHHANADFYNETLTFNYLDKLNKDEFIDFFFQFAVDGGKIQSGGHRTAPKLKITLENNYEDFRKYLLEPFGDSFNVESWLKRIENYNGFGSGIATIYLDRINKSLYGIVNNKSIEGFTKIGYTFNTKLIDQYNKILSVVSELINEYPQLSDFYKTDALTHFVIAVDEGIEIINELFKESKTPIIMNYFPLNQILYGPPGTGKTYNTINEAIKIVEELSDEELLQKYPKREDLRKAFKSYLEEDEAHISFCTFHQSFSYEDFVEGIKPLKAKDDDTFLKYEIQDGVFKLMCSRADSWDKQISDSPINNSGFMDLSSKELQNAIFYKMSLGDSTNEDDKEIYEYCIRENKIALGWGEMVDISNLTNEHDIYTKIQENGQIKMAARYLNYFKLYMKVGNYVVVSNGNTRIRAIGKITGEYEFKENSPIQYHHFRSVDWIIKDVDIPVKEFYDKLFQQQTIYKLNGYFIKQKFFTSKDENRKGVEQETVKRNHVLIIDEINRGNISQIFGELITLIEKDKRKGKDEELQVILPYSKKKFYVPANLYIIGTMNTADRSIEALDTALRRRFSFKEMPPKNKLIIDKGITPNKDGIVEGIDLVELLDTINKRIEKLLDKDHKIGHSYFMTVNSLKSLENAFKEKVIPLLEEYFYGDLGKIGLVLGNSFVEVENGADNGFYFAEFEGYDSDIADDLKTKKVYKITSSDKWNFESIYNLSKE